MNNPLKQVQINLFADLPEDTRTLLIQLAQTKPNLKTKPVLIPDIIASPIAILLGVCRELNLAPMDLRSPSRKAIYAQGRFIAYYLLRTNRIGLANIAMLFRRDHSSVMYGTDTHMDLIRTNAPYQRKYQQVIERIKEFADQEAVAV